MPRHAASSWRPLSWSRDAEGRRAPSFDRYPSDAVLARVIAMSFPAEPHALGTGRARPGGLLGVVASDGRLFRPDERRALGAVAARIAFEFEWRLLHERLLTEIDGLRESPHLDPRLAIWTLPGLQYLAAMRFADAARSGQTLGVLVLHLHSLHAVNQRVGAGRRPAPSGRSGRRGRAQCEPSR